MANFVSPFEKWGRRRCHFRPSWHYLWASQGPENWKWNLKKYCTFVRSSMDENCRTTWTSLLRPSFCRNNDCIMENIDKRLTVPKWALIVLTKIPPNAPEFICLICLPNAKRFGFQWKKASMGICSPWIKSWNSALKSYFCFSRRTRQKWLQNFEIPQLPPLVRVVEDR